ncbi:GGDEF domain-containing protein [Arsenicicoccus piscis]|uniref:GGDEF domain-containing protein n=1 Tax=Arsenicicoccus piscis TaxID=673954 RepID=A0ABQ6HPF8_9MICO|nr:GGDEF domain-containing protein [Arsenicicoccus piscis]MCH8628455.1 GGDEF domain-containing protein [Arsenicicoccus piscis]GMA19983.1 hypothetical protein GCM10025862_20040 [Arsenicicoccus piscis]
MRDAPPAFRVYLTIAPMLLVMYLGVGDPTARAGIIVVCAVLTPVVQAVGLMMNRPLRSGSWWWILSAEALWFSAAMIGPQWSWGHAPGVGQIHDLLDLLGYALIVPAGLSLSRSLDFGRDEDGAIDTAILVIGASAVVWVLTMDPDRFARRAAAHGQLVALAYPFVGLLMVAVVVRLLFRISRPSVSLSLLLVSVVMLIVGDITHLAAPEVGSSHRDISVWYLIAYLSIGLSALHPTARELGRPHSVAPSPAAGGIRLGVLGIFSVMPPLMLFFGGAALAGAHPFVLSAAALIVFVLVMVRLAQMVDVVGHQTELLSSQARTDHLTGLPNRRTTDAELDRAIVDAAEDGTALVVALIDLDHFKRYNDRFGHQAGDTLLIGGTTAWRQVLPPDVFLGRYGGEEFIVVTRGRTPDEAVALVDALRPRTPGGQTFSAGLATWDGLEPGSGLVRRADRALYAAKAAGRCCTVQTRGHQRLVVIGSEATPVPAGSVPA